MRLLGQRKRLHSDPSEVDSAVQRPTNKWKCFRSSAFWLLFCGVLLQGLGGFVPGTYLPCELPSLPGVMAIGRSLSGLAFATAIHLGAPVGTLSIALSMASTRTACKRNGVLTFDREQ
jgi:hypothetical protein